MGTNGRTEQPIHGKARIYATGDEFVTELLQLVGEWNSVVQVSVLHGNQRNRRSFQNTVSDFYETQHESTSK